LEQHSRVFSFALVRTACHPHRTLFSSALVRTVAQVEKMYLMPGFTSRLQ